MNEETAAPGRGHRPAVRHQGRHHSRPRREVVRARARLGPRIRVRIGDRYVVFKILDEMTAQLNPRQRMRIAEEFERKKHRIAKAELVAELRDQ